MKRLVLVVAVLLAAGVPAAQAATSPADKAAIRKLQAQVRTLTSQVSALSGRVSALGRENDELRQATASMVGVVDRLDDRDFCEFAVTFDAIFLMMYNDDVLFSALGAGRVYGPQSGVNDQGACAAIGVNRTPWAPRYRASSTPALSALVAPAAIVGAAGQLRR